MVNSIFIQIDHLTCVAGAIEVRNSYSMTSDFSKFLSFDPPPHRPAPQPGEIWQVQRSQSPLTVAEVELASLYSEAAQRFLRGDFPAHYVMIVRVLGPEDGIIDPEGRWQPLIGMVLSEDITALSDIDVLIPTVVSGLNHDLLAETWHVLPMLGLICKEQLGIVCLE
jgi:hypothetical protein